MLGRKVAGRAAHPHHQGQGRSHGKGDDGRRHRATTPARRCTLAAGGRRTLCVEAGLQTGTKVTRGRRRGRGTQTRIDRPECLEPRRERRVAVELRTQLRFALGVELVANGTQIPLWVSAVGCLVPGAIAVLLWRESSGAAGKRPD